MGAKSKPTETLSLADIGVEPERVGTRRLADDGPALAPPPSKGDQVKIEDDGSAAEKLVDWLAGEEVAVSTLVFLEHHDGAIQKGALGVLARALALGGDVAGVVVGHAVGDVAAAAGRVRRLRPSTSSTLPPSRRRCRSRGSTRSRPSSPRRGAENVLFAASVLSADVAAGLSARLDAGLNWDLTDFAIDGGRLVGKRPALGDTVLVDVGWTSDAADRARPFGRLRAGRDGR